MENSVVLQSAVRLPTPPPVVPDGPSLHSGAKRKRLSTSRSPSPRRRRSPPLGPSNHSSELPAIQHERDFERKRQMVDIPPDGNVSKPKPLSEEEKQAAAK